MEIKYKEFPAYAVNRILFLHLQKQFSWSLAFPRWKLWFGQMSFYCIPLNLDLCSTRNLWWNIWRLNTWLSAVDQHWGGDSNCMWDLGTRCQADASTTGCLVFHKPPNTRPSVLPSTQNTGALTCSCRCANPAAMWAAVPQRLCSAHLSALKRPHENT